MSDPINVGDLVMMVRGHSCLLSAIGGIPFVVGAITGDGESGWFCSRCLERNIARGECGARLVGFHLMTNGGVPLSWLKRIRPLGEAEAAIADLAYRAQRLEDVNAAVKQALV